METKRMVAFQLSDSQYDMLSKLAKANFRSLSAELRVAVTSYIQSNQILSVEVQKSDRGLSGVTRED